MQQTEQTAGLGGAERKRVEAVVETLANLRIEGENLAEVAHDARNMVTALGLYCDLLQEPGVLAAPYLHYGNELRLVASASRRLVERLVALDRRGVPGVEPSLGGPQEPGGLPAQSANAPNAASLDRLGQARRWGLMPAQPIDSLAAELAANRNLLSALAGPSITLTADAEGGERPVWLTGEDLTRVLVNLVKNAAEAMPAGGRIALGLHEFHAGAEAGPWLVLTIEDNGPGIPRKALEKIFESGYTSRAHTAPASGGWAGAHRGLGLAITRSIVEGAGGRIHAANRTSPGARFEIELPVRSR
jgi:signal transduction histidine kinase